MRAGRSGPSLATNRRELTRRARGLNEITPDIRRDVNAGEDGSIVVGKISDNDTYTYGYDAQEGQYGDLVSKEGHH
jgi:hypothetical protein